MNAAGNNRTPQKFPLAEYLLEMQTSLGRSLTVETKVNGRSVRSVSGTLDFVSPKFFGVRVIKGQGSYLSTFLFTDVFTGKIVYSFDAN